MVDNSYDRLFIPTMEIEYLERKVNDEGRLDDPKSEIFYQSEYVQAKSIFFTGPWIGFAFWFVFLVVNAIFNIYCFYKYNPNI